MLLGKHADDEAGRAVPTLRSTALRHGLLRASQYARFGQGFDGVDFMAAGGGKWNKAAVHRLISRPLGGGSDEQNGAGAAFAFGATFFGAGEPALSYIIEQRHVRPLSRPPGRFRRSEQTQHPRADAMLIPA